MNKGCKASKHANMNTPQQTESSKFSRYYISYCVPVSQAPRHQPAVRSVLLQPLYQAIIAQAAAAAAAAGTGTGTGTGDAVGVTLTTESHGGRQGCMATIARLSRLQPGVMEGFQSRRTGVCITRTRKRQLDGHQCDKDMI